MIGYHHTTWEAYQKIRETGLQLSELEERHRVTFPEVLPFVKNGCIWVYPEFMQCLELVGAIFYSAIRHTSHRLVCLEVEYPEWVSATYLADQKYDNDGVYVRLTHRLKGAGPFDHCKRFDLITEPVSVDQIRVVGEWNLVDLIQFGVRQLRVVARPDRRARSA